MADSEIIKLIVDHPSCVACLATKTGFSEIDVLTALRDVARTLTIVVARGPCRDCQQVKQTYTMLSRN